MSEQLVALTRQDGRLSAIVSRVVAGGETGDGERKPLEYRLAQEPVADVKGRDARERRALDAWQRAESLRLGEPSSVAAAIGVLLATVPVGAPEGGASPSSGRAWLCQPRAWSALRAQLDARPAAVLRQLRAAGWGPAVARLFHARDPYLAYHHGAVGAPALQALPSTFRACVLPVLRGRSWAEVRGALSLYWALDLAGREADLAAVVRLLAGRHGLAWLEQAAAASPQCRGSVIAAVLEAGAENADPSGLPSGLFAAFGLDDPEGDADRLGHLLRSLRRGVPPAETLDQLRIAAAFAPRYRFACRPSPASALRHPHLPARHAGDLERLLVRFRDAGALDTSYGFAARLWRWTVESPEHAAVLTRPAVFEWPASTARDVLDVLMRGGSRVWTVRARCQGFEWLLARVPPSHQARAVAEGGEVLDHVPARATTRAMALVARLARPPYRTVLGDAPGAAALLARVAGERWERLAQVPERTLQRLDRALADDQGILPLVAGLRAMGARAAALFWAALAAHPEPLFATARQLGLLSAPRRRLVLKRFRAQPVAQRRFEKRPLDAVCSAIERVVARGLASPMPRRLRSHREGRIVLSPGSLERHRQAIVRRLLPFRLALLRQLALDDVRRGLPMDVRDDGERHAVQLLGTVTENRRLLRRILRVAPGVRSSFLEEHPANRAWLARHPRAQADAWHRGPVQEVTAGGERLTLALERDPLEVLRIGTRVGSCLAVGGCHDDAAVASMADANKRVVVARDARGAFVARQRIAISEDDRLVCAPVYPLGVAPPVAGAFLEYDHALARTLAVPLVPWGDRAYDVGPVLARYDYDDGVWERIEPAE
jgi:hypothetical protein